MRTTGWLVIGALATACNKTTEAPPQGVPASNAAPVSSIASASSASSAPATADATPAPVAKGPPIAALPTIEVAAACADSALFLVEVPLEKAAARFCEVCGSIDAKACKGDWPEDFVAPGAPSKDRLDVMRNTIYAAHGYPFKKEKWKKIFAGKSWYAAKPQFKPSDLSTVASANVALLATDPSAGGSGLLFELARGKSAPFDVDGDGKPETVSLATDGSKATVGAVTIGALDHLPKSLAAEDHPDIAGIAILDIDPKKPGKQLAVRYDWDEDEEGWVVFDLGPTKATYVGEVRPGAVPGDGTVVVTSGQCGVTTVTKYKLAKGGFVAAGETKTGKYDANSCAACPYVYSLSANGRALQGEILRHQSSEADYRLDALPIDAVVVDGVVRIQLRELDHETTRLDSIALEIDGQLVEPLECGAATNGTPCTTDRSFVILDPGSIHGFTFPWRGPTPQTIVLRANGYYLPL
jgi:hypothetical protein